MIFLSFSKKTRWLSKTRNAIHAIACKKTFLRKKTQNHFISLSECNELKASWYGLQRQRQSRNNKGNKFHWSLDTLRDTTPPQSQSMTLELFYEHTSKYIYVYKEFLPFLMSRVWGEKNIQNRCDFLWIRSGLRNVVCVLRIILILFFWWIEKD